MNTFKIINFDAAAGQIFVEFDAKMAPLVIDVPIKEDGNFLSGDELNTYITGFIPVWHIERINKLSQGIPNANEIAAMVVEPTSISTELSAEEVAAIEAREANQRMLQEMAFEKKLAKALIKFGVLQSDPTEIPVSAQ